MAKHVPAGDFTVGWICALAVELAAALEMLDEKYAYHQLYPNDFNNYSFGRVGEHNVVVVGLPAGQIGTSPAATAVTQMYMRFPSLRFSLLVGIAGAVPGRHDIRLGDVVISKPMGLHGGVVQYDFGKTGPDGRIKITGHLDAPPPILLCALTSLEANAMLDAVDVDRHLAKIVSRPYFQSPGPKKDTLYSPLSKHVEGATCEGCRRDDVLPRSPRSSTRPVLFTGTIASGNQVIKDAPTRDRYSQDLNDDILCFEMEAAGLMRSFRCLIIRGMCDYADAHKNNDWQPYAAATAAAYAKELLSIIPAEMSAELDVSTTLERAGAPGASKAIQESPAMPAKAQTESRLPSASETTMPVRAVLRRPPLGAEPSTGPASPRDAGTSEEPTATEDDGSAIRYQGVTTPATKNKKKSTTEMADDVADLHDKAVALHEEGKLEEAEAVYRDCLERVTQLWGPRHDHRMDVIGHLVKCLRRQSKWRSMQHFASELLPLRRALLGAKHGHTIDTMCDLGQCYFEQGLYKDSKAMYKKAAALADSAFGPTSTLARLARSNLCQLYEKMGFDLFKGKDLYKDLVDMETSVLGPNHPDTLKVKFRMGRFLALYGIGDLVADGKDILYETLRSLQEVQGPAHITTLECMLSTACIFDHIGMLHDAAPIYSEYLTLARRVHKDDPDHIKGVEEQLDRVRDRIIRHDEKEMAKSKIRRALSKALSLQWL